MTAERDDARWEVSRLEQELHRSSAHNNSINATPTEGLNWKSRPTQSQGTSPGVMTADSDGVGVVRDSDELQRVRTDVERAKVALGKAENERDLAVRRNLRLESELAAASGECATLTDFRETQATDRLKRQLKETQAALAKAGGPFVRGFSDCSTIFAATYLH